MVVIPDLRIRLKRHSDRSASLTLTRRDGSVTWQRQKGALALVFPQHDLTHFAVETTLGYRGAFYGLVADGWEINDFATPWPRGPIPVEAREVEMLVGLFDGMRRDRATWDAAELNRRMRVLVDDSKFVERITPRLLSDADVAAVRHCATRCWHGGLPSSPATPSSSTSLAPSASEHPPAPALTAVSAAPRRNAPLLVDVPPQVHVPFTVADS